MKARQVKDFASVSKLALSRGYSRVHQIFNIPGGEIPNRKFPYKFDLFALDFKKCQGKMGELMIVPGKIYKQK